MIYLIVIIYLTGSVVCYLTEKKYVKEVFGSWWKSDRTFALGLSLISWLGALISYVVRSGDINNDASW